MADASNIPSLTLLKQDFYCSKEKIFKKYMANALNIFNQVIKIVLILIGNKPYLDRAINLAKLIQTRTAWAVFKYCGTKTAPLRRNFI